MIGAGREGTQHRQLEEDPMHPSPKRQEASRTSKVNHIPVAFGTLSHPVQVHILALFPPAF